MDNCVASTNYCNAHDYQCRYPNNDACDITVNAPGTLSTEYIYIYGGDKLTLKGKGANGADIIYHGDYTPANGPNDVQLSTGDMITWRSDSRSNINGWKICLNGGQTTAEMGVYTIPGLVEKKIIPVSAGSVTSIEFDDDGNNFAVGFDTKQNSVGVGQFIRTYSKDGSLNV